MNVSWKQWAKRGTHTLRQAEATQHWPNEERPRRKQGRHGAEHAVNTVERWG